MAALSRANSLAAQTNAPIDNVPTVIETAEDIELPPFDGGVPPETLSNSEQDAPMDDEMDELAEDEGDIAAETASNSNRNEDAPLDDEMREVAEGEDEHVEQVDQEAQYMPEPSEAPSSPRSWFDISTPLPTPPGSPLARSDAGESENEDGYINVTAEDYREYDRWYAEDLQAEVDELRGDILTDEEIDSIKMMAIRLFGHISQRNYERIRYSYRQKIRLLTLQRLHTRVANLSGVSPRVIDCCINICHAYTGDKANLTACAVCGEPRYDLKGRARQIFEYLPLIIRLQAMYNNPDLIRRMLYRLYYDQEPGAVNDFFDSELYKLLCESNIVIDGIDTGKKFFAGMYDLATALLCDGVQIFDGGSEQNSTCWPLMLQNLNLPPSERAQLRNLIPLGVIPGPNQPKDFDSFLVPFVEECLELAQGVRTYNALTGKYFTLRHHPVIVGGDMQAIKHMEQMKGPKSKVPCRDCEIVGVYSTERRTYYVPLTHPISSDAPGEAQGYDPNNLPLRTEERMARQTRRIENAANKNELDDLTKRFGISGPSILDRIPSIKRPTSYPHEFMHLFLINHGPGLVSLWTNSYKGISDAGLGDYLISRADWVQIGEETEAATKLIPAAFIRPLPNIQTNWGLYCAESWSFWLVYIGPIVLRGRLPQKYYDHYLELVAILKCLLQLTNTVERLQELKEQVIGYVERFEEYYYQYSYERLCICKLTLHALLHIPDNVIRCGPVWVSWSFSIERYCREVTACALSKVVPYATINKHVLQMAQLAAISSRFQSIRKALLFGKNDNPVNISRMERIYEEYPNTILRFPCLRQFLLQPNVRRRLAAFFQANNPQRTFHEWLKFIPERCERWGKLRIDGGDCIRSASACDPLSPYGKRDASFVRYVYRKDKNEDYPSRPVEMVTATAYGRLDFILALTLPKSERFDIPEPQLYILAHITEAKGTTGDATESLVSFRQMGRSFILDVQGIENVVGRVETKGVVPGGEWVIVDRSNSMCRTTFDEVDDKYEE